MKTLLVVSPNPAPRALLEKQLAKHFALEFDQDREVDVVVCDVPDLGNSWDILWIKNLDVPTVVLAPPGSAPTPEAPNRSIVTYPLNMDRILEALARMGLRSGARGRD